MANSGHRGLRTERNWSLRSEWNRAIAGTFRNGFTLGQRGEATMSGRRRQLIILIASLTSARIAYGVQFQSAGALGPSIMRDLGVDYAAFGALIGAYSLLGIALSLPSGWLIARLGTKRVALSGLALMTIGGLLSAIAPEFSIAIVGRLVSGAGAVLIMVALPTIILEQFPANAVSIPMSVLLSGFPVGIGLGFLGLPLFGSWRVAMVLTAILAAVAFFWIAITTPARVKGADALRRSWPRRGSLIAAIAAGAVWGLINAGFAVLLAFAPAFYFATSGLSAHSVGAIVSLAAFASVPVSPAGAWIVDRLGQPVPAIAAGLLATAGILFSISLGAWPIALLVSAGIIIGLVAGPIVSLPGPVLTASERPLGMAVFWLTFFIPMGLLPPLAGYIRDISGDAASAIGTGAAFPLLALIPLMIYAFAMNGLRRGLRQAT
jgi:predicted MFS family arabinose efflux permease